MKNIIKKIELLLLTFVLTFTSVLVNPVYAKNDQAEWYTIVPIINTSKDYYEILTRVYEDREKAKIEGIAADRFNSIYMQDNCLWRRKNNDKPIASANSPAITFNNTFSDDSYRVLSVPSYNIKYMNDENIIRDYNDYSLVQQIAEDAQTEINSILAILNTQSDIHLEDLAKFLKDGTQNATINGFTLEMKNNTAKHAKPEEKIVTISNSKGITENINIHQWFNTGYPKDSNLTAIEKFYLSDFIYVALFYKKGIIINPNNSTMRSGSITNGYECFEEENDLIDGLMETLFTGITSLAAGIGLRNVEDLVFARDSSWFFGIMRTSWFRYLSVIYWVMLIISIIVLVISILKLLTKRNLAIISPSIRSSLKDGITKIILSIILIGLSIPIFYLIVWLNYQVIQIFSDMVGTKTLFNALSGGSFLMSIAVFIIEMILLFKINIKYITRALTVGICYAISPVAISTLGLTDNGGIFWTWFKEMFVEIFTQTFDAVLLTVIIFIASGRVSLMENILLAFSFIPISKWFKNTLMGFSGQGSEGAAEQIGTSVEKGAKAVGGAAVGLAVTGATAASKIQTNKVENKKIDADNKATQRQSKENEAENKKHEEFIQKDKDGNVMKDEFGDTIYTDGYKEKATLGNGRLELQERHKGGAAGAILGAAVSRTKAGRAYAGTKKVVNDIKDKNNFNQSRADGKVSKDDEEKQRILNEQAQEISQKEFDETFKESKVKKTDKNDKTFGNEFSHVVEINNENAKKMGYEDIEDFKNHNPAYTTKKYGDTMKIGVNIKGAGPTAKYNFNPNPNLNQNQGQNQNQNQNQNTNSKYNSAKEAYKKSKN